jgi:hypothetical protein
MFTLLIFLSLTIAKTSKKYKNKSENIKARAVEPQKCEGSSHSNQEDCQDAFVAVSSKLGGADDTALLTAVETYVANCLGTLCGVSECKALFQTKIEEGGVITQLTNFDNVCDPSKNQPGENPPPDQPGENPPPDQPNDVTSGEDNETSATVQAPGEQKPGKGYQRWNTKEIGLLMILTNLIGLLYLVS